MATNLSPATIFNPDVKDTPAPSWFALSKEPTGPKLVSGTAELIKGAATIGADVVKVAHTLTQQTLDDQIAAKVDEIREPYKEDLGKAAAAVQPKRIVQRVDVKGNPIGPAAEIDLLGNVSTPSEAPAGLDTLNENLTTLGSARANNKLSRTDYIARLDVLAKEFRSNYPGWRDYIDAKIEKHTGMTPANALIQSRISDINSFIQQSKTEKDKVFNILTREENMKIPGMDEVIALWRAGHKSDFEALRFVNQNLQKKYDTEQSELDLKDTESKIKNKQLQATQILSQKIAQRVTNDLDVLFSSFGLNKDPATAIKELQSRAVDPETARQIESNIRGRMTQIVTATRADAYAPYRDKDGKPLPNGQSLGFFAGAKAIDEQLTEHLKTHESIAQLIGNKDFGMAGFLARMSTAKEDARANAIFNSKMGDTLLNSKVVRQSVGDQAAGVLIPPLLAGKLPGLYDEFTADEMLTRMAGSPDPVTGKVKTLRESIEEANTKVLGDKTIPPEQKNAVIGAVVQRYLEQIDKIGDPATPAILKKRYIEDAFSPEAKGLIAKLDDAGRTKVLTRLMDRKITDQTYQVGGDHWAMYSDYVRSTLTSEYLVPEVSKFNKFQANPYLKFNWDNERHRFRVDYDEGATGKGVDLYLVNTSEVNNFIQKFNTVLDRYSYVLGKESADVNAEVLRTIMRVGAQVNKTNGLPAELVKAMVASQPPKPEPGATAPKKEEPAPVKIPVPLESLPSPIPSLPRGSTSNRPPSVRAAGVPANAVWDAEQSLWLSPTGGAFHRNGERFIAP